MNHRCYLLQKLERVETTFKKVFLNQQFAAPRRCRQEPPGPPLLRHWVQRKASQGVLPLTCNKRRINFESSRLCGPRCRRCGDGRPQITRHTLKGIQNKVNKTFVFLENKYFSQLYNMYEIC